MIGAFFLFASFDTVHYVRLLPAVAEIYGGRSGTLGSWRLTRAVLTHLVATGAVAVGDVEHRLRLSQTTDVEVGGGEHVAHARLARPQRSPRSAGH